MPGLSDDTLTARRLVPRSAVVKRCATVTFAECQCQSEWEPIADRMIDDLEHFQAKRETVCRPKMRPCKKLERFRFPLELKVL
jgi:hypothetical protein